MKTSPITPSARSGKTARTLAMVACLSTVFLLAAGGALAAKTRPLVHFVNVASTGANDGTNWTDAYTDLQDALNTAVAGDEVWVAAGTYKPHLSDRTSSFVLKSGVALYGGFMGGETALEQRSSDPGLVILSGDIGVAGDDADNSYHVVYADGVTGAVLDGVTVTGGQADGSYQGDYDSGGGMYTHDSILTVSNSVFVDNVADRAGGGMYNEASTLTVSDCLFTRNRAGKRFYSYERGMGGGMYNFGRYAGSDQSSVITGCTFIQNETGSSDYIGAYGGAGMYNLETNPTIDRCTFERNRAWGNNAVGGGMVNNSAWSTVTNCVFDGNMAYLGGGGVANYGPTDISHSTFYRNSWFPIPGAYITATTQRGGALYLVGGGGRIVDVIFSGNVTQGPGGAIYAERCRGPMEIIKSLFHENRAGFYTNGFGSVIDHIGGASMCLPQLTDSLVDVDPLLTDPDNGDFHLLAGSPAIDAGLTRQDVCFANVCYLPLPDTDFDGDARLVDGDGFAGKAADIGADEYLPTLEELRALIVDLAADDLLDEVSAIVLLAYVDDVQNALDAGDAKAAKRILEQMIDGLMAMEDDEIIDLILKKAVAVHGTLD